jgi:hypothetical protein
MVRKVILVVLAPAEEPTQEWFPFVNRFRIKREAKLAGNLVGEAGVR